MRFLFRVVWHWFGCRDAVEIARPRVVVVGLEGRLTRQLGEGDVLTS